ncbi:hypothetical protein PGB90_009124 [Kerria lacca]
MWVGGRGRRRRRHRILYTASDHYTSNFAEFHDLDAGNMKKKSNKSSNCLKYWTIIAISALFALMTPASSSVMLPVWKTQHSLTGTGRNIRHLPCVSRRTGETGLCMFAYSCAKANGTHLGTCIDRFYFGSCCKISGNSDPDLLEPIVHNYLNKDDVHSTKLPYQKPSFLPDITTDSSTMSLSASISTMTRPVSIIPSSTSDFFSSTYIKTSSQKPSSIYTNSTGSHETIPITSRTPLVNVTFMQTSVSHVTAAPLVYSTTLSTVYQTATHKPSPALVTTAYSKPPSKPTTKPNNKPKPPSQGKPGLVKPKPTKPSSKPSSQGTTSSTLYPSSVYTPSSISINTYFNKTTLNGILSPKPSFVTTEVSVPTKVTSKPSSQGVPTPITLFTSSKRPTKPSKPSIYTTTSLPSSYVKIPVSTVGQSNKPSSSSSVYVSSTMSSNTVTIDQHLKINTTANDVTEKPSKPWPSSLSSSAVLWNSSTTLSSTSSQLGLSTWTTIEEIPAVILPDRTKPTSIIKPSGKPPITKPTFIPTFTKPSSTTERFSTKPEISKPTSKPVNENQRPSIASSSPSSTSDGASSGWVEVALTTYAPTTSPLSSTQDVSEGLTVNIITQSTSKPSTSVTIPVASPLPIETTATSLETNEIEPTGINMSDYRDVCGRRLYPTPRIVGGEKATFGEWPWQISLRQWRTSTYLHKCGAALFNENWAVTAAHCVENVPPSDLLLRLGEHDLSMEEEPYGYQERRVQIVASHPQFDPRTFEYDLALLRFYEPVKFQPNIIPVCVPEDDTNFVGSQAYVTGWGRLYEDGPLPSVLQQVSVPVINNSVCESMYQAAGYIEHIPNIFICAGWRKGGFDSCEGDSGGPMVIQRPDKRWLLAGIISWGIGCAEPNQPGVYTRISEFRDWINQILQF